MDRAPQSGLGRGRLAVSGDLTVDNGHAGLTLEVTAGGKTITLPNGTFSDGACLIVQSAPYIVTIACVGGILYPFNGGVSGSSITTETDRSVILQATSAGGAAWRVIGGTAAVACATREGVRTLTDQATLATDCDRASTFDVTLGASRTMGAPTNMATGQRCVWRIKQGGTGSYVITWNAAFRFSTTVPSPTLSTAVGTMDMVGAIYNSTASKWDVCAVSLGYT